MSYSFFTVQLVGIPLTPVDQLFILEALTNVPDDDTSTTQLDRQNLADIFVARHLIWLKLEQSLNIPA